MRESELQTQCQKTLKERNIVVPDHKHDHANYRSAHFSRYVSEARESIYELGKMIESIKKLSRNGDIVKTCSGLCDDRVELSDIKDKLLNLAGKCY